MAYKLCYKPFGIHAVLIEWPAQISEDILEDVLVLKEKIEKSNIKDIVQVNNTYSSLVVFYDKNDDCFISRKSIIDKIYTTSISGFYSHVITWRIPVCYDTHFALDLEAVSVQKNISKSDVVSRHFKNIYTVYFIGFLPGFLYLGGLDKSLITPRKSTPRLKVEKGAVAIGGNQTGVYPNESPGGWNIIGNSPINFFDVSKENPCFAKAGDRVQFYPISLKEYHNIKTLVDAGVYQIESKEQDD